MQRLVSLVLLLLPGALAAALHFGLKGRAKGLRRVFVYAAYTLVISGLLCGLKLLRGAVLASFWTWFSAPLSFTFYFTAACAAAALLPLGFVLVTEKRLALRLYAGSPAANATEALPWSARKAARFLPRLLAALAAGILLGFLLITASYLLPVDRIQQNVRKSAATVEREGSYPFLYENWRSTRLDNFTDSIMLLLAAYPGDGNAVQNAMLSTYARFADHDPAQGLVKWATGATDGYQTHSYARYWHGYLVWLKPLLLFFDYGQIRILNTVLQCLLSALVLFLMFRKGCKRLMLPFLLTALFLTPTALFQSFQFSWVFYVTAAAVLCLLLGFERREAARSFWRLFLFTGMATSYVDFLTYPLITLGVPLALYLAMRGHTSWKTSVADVAGLSLAWGIGYVGMWAGKWALCGLLTGSDVLSTVQGNILARMSNAYMEETFNWAEVLKRNIEAYNHWLYLGPFLLCLAGYALLFGREQITLSGGTLRVSKQWAGGALLPLALAALIPFAWYFVASNHTYIHYWYAHRTLAVTAFAIPAVFAWRAPRQVQPGR